MTTRQQRRQVVLELVNRNEITSQEQLQELLAVEGINATQATVSRDLRDLGVIKTPGRQHGQPPLYTVVDLDNLADPDTNDLKRALKSDVRAIERAASVLVLKTNFGMAKALAAKLEQSKLPQVVGTMASDDTIFIATRSPGQAGELRRMLERLGK